MKEKPCFILLIIYAFLLSAAKYVSSILKVVIRIDVFGLDKALFKKHAPNSLLPWWCPSVDQAIFLMFLVISLS
jgi:hypothetical protein